MDIKKTSSGTPKKREGAYAYDATPGLVSVSDGASQTTTYAVNGDGDRASQSDGQDGALCK
jgi:hypothetical protein